MRFFREIILAIRSFAVAHHFIKKHKLWLYVILPGVINLLLLGGIIYVAFQFSTVFSDWIFSTFGLEGISDGAVGILKSILNFALLFMVRVIIILAYLTVYKYIVLIIMAPFLAYLSERTEELLTGKKYPFTIIQFCKDVLRGILLAMINLIKEILITILLFLLVYVPIVNLVCPFLVFIVQSYYYGFSMMDYYNERRKLTIRESGRFIYKHKGIAIANGGGFYLLLMIPIIGLLIAPTYTIVAANIAVLKLEEKRKS